MHTFHTTLNTRISVASLVLFDPWELHCYMNYDEPTRLRTHGMSRDHPTPRDQQTFMLPSQFSRLQYHNRREFDPNVQWANYDWKMKRHSYEFTFHMKLIYNFWGINDIFLRNFYLTFVFNNTFFVIWNNEVFRNNPKKNLLYWECIFGYDL